MNDRRDVHTEHCCERHGCKYGSGGRDGFCSVVDGGWPQSYDCEVCDFVREQVAVFLPEATVDELLAELASRGSVMQHCELNAYEPGDSPLAVASAKAQQRS